MNLMDSIQVTQLKSMYPHSHMGLHNAQDISASTNTVMPNLSLATTGLNIVTAANPSSNSNSSFVNGIVGGPHNQNSLSASQQPTPNTSTTHFMPVATSVCMNNIQIQPIQLQGPQSIVATHSLPHNQLYARGATASTQQVNAVNPAPCQFLQIQLGPNSLANTVAAANGSVGLLSSLNGRGAAIGRVSTGCHTDPSTTTSAKIVQIMNTGTQLLPDTNSNLSNGSVASNVSPPPSITSSSDPSTATATSEFDMNSSSPTSKISSLATFKREINTSGGHLNANLNQLTDANFVSAGGLNNPTNTMMKFQDSSDKIFATANSSFKSSLTSSVTNTVTSSPSSASGGGGMISSHGSGRSSVRNGKGFRCQICERVFTQKGNLKTHLMTHSGERPYECQTCGKNFTQKGNLDTHVKIHTETKDHKCQFCDKGFTQRGNLKTHIRSIHTKEKPYACSHCGKAFSQKGNMLTHYRTHDKEARFPCDTCGKTFSQKITLWLAVLLVVIALMLFWSIYHLVDWHADSEASPPKGRSKISGQAKVASNSELKENKESPPPAIEGTSSDETASQTFIGKVSSSPPDPGRIKLNLIRVG